MHEAKTPDLAAIVHSRIEEEIRCSLEILCPYTEFATPTQYFSGIVPIEQTWKWSVAQSMSGKWARVKACLADGIDLLIVQPRST